MTEPLRVLAVDLGASSIRVAAVDLNSPAPEIDVIHRWHHGPVAAADGTLRWDWPRIVAEVQLGLEKGIAGGHVASIGVDGWGVDYGLIGDDGSLTSLPYSYRDLRTERWEEIADELGTDRLYQLTGIQLMGFNTIFQLAAHNRAELGVARRLLLLPDLLVHDLTGHQSAERSNVSTTALMDVRTGDWSRDLIDALSLDPSLFPPVVPAGLGVGSWRGVPVHLVGSHDTASAFLGMPGGSVPGTVFVSTGTWVIVGIEREEVDTSARAREANFSNEAGGLGGVRFLKNVVGFWILEQCRTAWGDPSIEVLLDEAAAISSPVPIFDAGDHRFVNPADMVAEVTEATELPANASRGLISRSVMDSIVAGISRVIDELASITGIGMTQIALVGGGARVTLLHRLLAERTGLPVVRGSQEATALGNAIAQGLAIGRFTDVGHARGWLEPTGAAA